MFQLPDSTNVSLINDSDNEVTMTSFINEHFILLKLKHRFLVFDNEARFISQCIFDDVKCKNSLSHQLKEDEDQSGDQVVE